LGWAVTALSFVLFNQPLRFNFYSHQRLGNRKTGAKRDIHPKRRGRKATASLSWHGTQHVLLVLPACLFRAFVLLRVSMTASFFLCHRNLSISRSLITLIPYGDWHIQPERAVVQQQSPGSLWPPTNQSLCSRGQLAEKAVWILP
jgi:hypothetical protein